MTRKEERRRAVKTSRGGGTALGKVNPQQRGASDQLSNTCTAFFLKERIRPSLHQSSNQNRVTCHHFTVCNWPSSCRPCGWGGPHSAWWCWGRSHDGCRGDTEREPPSQAGAGALGSLPTKVREQLESRSHKQGWRPGFRQSGRWARGRQGQAHRTLAVGLGAPLPSTA